MIYEYRTKVQHFQEFDIKFSLFNFRDFAWTVMDGLLILVNLPQPLQFCLPSPEKYHSGIVAIMYKTHLGIDSEQDSIFC